MTAASCKLEHTVNKTENDSKEPFLKYRYVIAFIGFLIFLQLSIHRTVTSVAIVAMVNYTAISHLPDTESDSCPNLVLNEHKNESFHVIKKQEGEFIWSPQIQGYVLGSYFLGCVITLVPSGILVERYGFKWFLFSATLITGILTLLIPPISWLSVYALIAVQMMRGLAQGFIEPSIAILTSNWFPRMERGSLFAFMLSATSLGTFCGSIFTGYICDSSGGWPYSFYAAGIAAVALSLCILLFVPESPKVCKNISNFELDFIQSNQESNLNQKRPKQPWSSILTSIPVYALALGNFAHLWSMSQFWTVQATFLGTIMHYPIAENGLFTAIPFLVEFLSNQVGCWISLHVQKRNLVSADFLWRFWTFISGIGFSACLLGMYFVGCNRSFIIIFSIISMGTIGLGAPGIAVVATNLTPTFAGTLHALICAVAYLSSFILPVIVGYLTDEMQVIEQWYKVFFITIAVVMLSKILFMIFGSAEVQPWNFVEENTQDNAEKQSDNCLEKYQK